MIDLRRTLDSLHCSSHFVLWMAKLKPRGTAYTHQAFLTLTQLFSAKPVMTIMFIITFIASDYAQTAEKFILTE